MQSLNVSYPCKPPINIAALSCLGWQFAQRNISSRNTDSFVTNWKPEMKHPEYNIEEHVLTNNIASDTIILRPIQYFIPRNLHEKTMCIASLRDSGCGRPLEKFLVREFAIYEEFYHEAKHCTGTCSYSGLLSSPSLGILCVIWTQTAQLQL